MSQLLRVRAEGFTALGAPNESGDDVGFFIERGGFAGWESSTDMRLQETARPLSAGSFDEDGFLGSRVVSVSGFAQADQPERLGHMRGTVMGLGARGKRVQVTVDMHGKSLWASARVYGKSSFTDQGDSLTARFQIQFWFPDPQKFGETNAFPAGASATVHHFGNYDAIPAVTVTGTGAYTISDGTHQFTVSNPIAPGQVDTIDFAKGWVYRNGVLLFGAVSRAETITVPPGLPKTTLTISGGPVMSTVAVTDTSV